MRTTLLVLAAAALLGSCRAASVADQSTMPKMETPSRIQADGGVQSGAARSLRAHKTAEEDDEERGFLQKYDKLLHSDFTKAKLNKMLTKETYAAKKFAKWQKSPLTQGDIEKAMLAKGEHYGILMTQYLTYLQRNPRLH
jgi:hypothetical protein